MRSHRAVLSILKSVLIFVEDLGVRLSDVLAKHGDGLVARLMVKSQQMHAKLIINVLGDGLTFIVLLCRFDTILLVLDTASHSGSPILDGRHTLLSEMALCIFVSLIRQPLLILGSTAMAMLGHRFGGLGLFHRHTILRNLTPKASI